ncbi:MAG: hypothetical protein FWE95_00650 [Planctomycetaceae bacterium]|nr:hypothetical protein [Planctomycetaceae bacterium]
MKRLLLCALFLFAAPSLAQEVDDSSYESLFTSAYQNETGAHVVSYPSHETREAIVKFDALDLFFLVHQPYQKTEDEAYDAWRTASFPVHSITERLFRAGRVDEGIALLKKMLPSQTPEEEMLHHGHISEALIEQKRFEEAWQLALSGPPQARAGNISQYIDRTIAKTGHEEDTIRTNANRLPPWVPNKDDEEIFRAEANRALEYLTTLLEQIEDDEERTRTTRVMPRVLAALGRSEEAYAFVDVENERGSDGLLRIILRERRENGTQEEVDYWFQKVQKLHEEGKIFGFNTHPSTVFIWLCQDAGKYIDIIDTEEKYLDSLDEARRRSPMGITGTPVGFVGRIPERIIETDFRDNSKELIDRLVNHRENFQEPSALDNQFYSRIIKMQLNLDLVDDAFESLRKINRASEALGSLVDIAFYALKHKTPEEASQIEEKAGQIFASAEGRANAMGNHRVDYHAQIAVRLMQDGESEMGIAFLEMALDGAEETQTQARMERICRTLITGGLLDMATKIADQIEVRFRMPGIRLQIAEERATVGETELAKIALRKAFEAVPRAERSVGSHTFARMAILATEFEDKELFYEIVNAAMRTVMETERYGIAFVAMPNSPPVGIFTRLLGRFGDKDHPLFEQEEKLADGMQAAHQRNMRSDLYLSLGVSRAMLGDHDNARRLLRKGMEVKQGERFGLEKICAAIIEAWSYEKP